MVSCVAFPPSYPLDWPSLAIATMAVRTELRRSFYCRRPSRYHEQLSTSTCSVSFLEPNARSLASPRYRFAPDGHRRAPAPSAVDAALTLGRPSTNW